MRYKISVSKVKAISLTFLAFFVALLAFCTHSYKNSIDYEIPFNNTAPKMYWDLFKDSVKSRLKVSVSINPKMRNPISHFVYKNYYVEVSKIDTIKNISLKQILTTSTKGKLRIDYASYFKMGSQAFTINYKTTHSKLHSLNLELNSKSVSTLKKNDTIADFYANFKAFSISYNGADTSQIWATSSGKYPDIPAYELPIDILFIKKQSGLYLLIMSVNEPKTLLKPGLLYSLIRQKSL